MKRREFLFGCGSTVVLAGLSLKSALAMSSSLSQSEVKAMTAAVGSSSWKSMLNEQFVLRDEVKGPVNLRLIAFRAGKADPKLDQFGITFVGKEDEKVAEGMYQMEHPRTGKFMLHLQPIDLGSAGAHYRADFCLLT